MARPARKKATGLGDTVEQVLEVTGVAKVAKFIMGDDCNCDKRKEFLNKMFPYNKPNCLLEHEYNYLHEFFSIPRHEVRPTEQTALLPIYSRVFNVRAEPTNCNSCWIEMIANLKKVYENYK